MRIINNIFARYRLKVSINKNATNTILYILMNPSKADRKQCDETVKKILEFTHVQSSTSNNVIQNVKTVVIVNLYPFYETKPERLQKVINEVKKNSKNEYQKLIKKNMKVIKKNIKEAEYCFRLG
ncbi:DUF1643 domain-containing protein [Desulfosporosinus sp. PR]|uniref:DUF1643 domain-containing protein n=1 Tax=Candidatus Desulfosporosinus nitrosoreducens TaxID=3401928 RepID=UPI0027F3F8CF|nr:DUF1643 domain-containing protein [Desulfosporosinus sp. PR]